MCIHAGGDEFQSVDIEAGIGLIEDGQARFEHGHLENLVALLLAAGEAGVDGAIEQRLIHLHGGHFVANQIEEIHGVELRLAVSLAHGVERRLEEIHIADAGNLDRILEGEENAGLSALFGVELEQVLAVVSDGAARNLIKVAAGEDLGERALARAVGAHDGVHLACVHGKGDALENFTVADGGVKIVDFE